MNDNYDPETYEALDAAYRRGRIAVYCVVGAAIIGAAIGWWF